MNDPITPTPPSAPGIVSANLSATTDKDDPLVEAWLKKIKAAERHWSKFHRRIRHNRKVVRGIDDSAEPEQAAYNKHRANLIQSTISVVLAKVYAKNPQMSGTPTNKDRDLALFCRTVETVTQTMLEDAGLKQKAKRTVRAAMTCSYGIVKVQYQRDIRTDPVIRQRIQDAQDNVVSIEALIAQVLVAKYADHVPLYRQAQIYARQDIRLDRSTLADWAGRAAWYLRPLRDRILEELRRSQRLFADETTAPVLDPGRGRTKTGQLWAYARDDRPWGGGDPPLVAYVYAPDRKSERAEAHLGSYSGILQVDGYSGYAALARRSQQLSLAFCWSHVRRKFYELADSSPVATEVLRRIAMLYAIENEVRGTSAEQRRAIRNGQARVILDDLNIYLEARLRQISAKSKLADAIRYALTRWTGLSLFLDDGRVELDSNTVERSIRPLALNRKNALFAGSDEGGDNWAVIATLIENCKISGVNPHTWLTETHNKLADGHPANHVGDLMPWVDVT